MVDRTEIEGIQTLLQGDATSHKIAGEILKNYTPEEIWNLLMEMGVDNPAVLNYTFLDEIFGYNNMKFSGSIQRADDTIYIFDCSNKRYIQPSEEFKQRLIKILTEESI